MAGGPQTGWRSPMHLGVLGSESPTFLILAPTVFRSDIQSATSFPVLTLAEHEGVVVGVTHGPGPSHRGVCLSLGDNKPETRDSRVGCRECWEGSFGLW